MNALAQFKRRTVQYGTKNDEYKAEIWEIFIKLRCNEDKKKIYKDYYWWDQYICFSLFYAKTIINMHFL